MSGEEEVLSKRVTSVLETHLERDKDALEALKEISEFYTQNTLECRRGLRTKIEKRSIALNENFLASFEKVKNAVNILHDNVNSLNTAVVSMSSQLKDTKIDTQNLIELTKRLQLERKNVCNQQLLADAYSKAFQLNPSEVGVLRSNVVTLEFFKALRKTQNISNNCRVLMQTGHQTSALSLMEQISTHQQMAMEVLYRWSQLNCKDIESTATGPLLVLAMEVLQDRPVLFKYVLEEYCTVRQAAIAQRFIDALAANNSNDTSLKTFSKDIRQYINNMLSWLIDHVPMERKYLTYLLKNCDKLNVDEEIATCMSSITESLCSPLASRVESVLHMNENPIDIYGVASSLKFYLQIVIKTVPIGQLCQTIEELHKTMECVFLNKLQNLVRDTLLERIEAPPLDLSPSPGIGQLLNILRQVLSVAAVTEDKQEDTSMIVSCVLEPLLQAINLSASRLTPLDMAVYRLNCLHNIHETLKQYQYVEDKLEKLQAHMTAQIETVSTEQANYLVTHLNLEDIQTILRGQGANIPLSQIQGMEAENLINFLSKLESMLVMPDSIAVPQIGYLKNPLHLNKIRRQSNEVISAVYKQLYDHVHDPTNEYDDPSSLMPRTPQLVYQILVNDEKPS
ncbi:conserved oligomeric Golgi complex subunit 6 isoform X2 [Sipha flava]|uniref:Conserved oligomeric Golgi complex subunit 6 n=1 Tax=Sipha flava TaxID=143950 RepID=A0A8B8G1G9_9HEMI|nr:conserved oligomeric Golgi complex subunit 6 isoform X2 [Sipha flava]XP_025416470.1 conserved oligomeric Golgi complex subunit 6 isoform X2 [Sipha flava]XP_025416473.1 conserved oligomeric Golgi complex subunit 6 isoform X2 [Sipha flava]XP_025416481.1 conserved oligomeric Golgi complex subunit 6 isoform X2 [Sipha flava]XP_025416490.1 conserved oligomeric Golgi complex subunit 6 isoform X2 [Sipha flava]